MGRKRSKEPGEAAQVEFNPTETKLLRQLIPIGGYGQTPAQVARYLVRRGIDDLMRAGVIAAASEGESQNEKV